MPQPTLLILGASGFLGGHLLRAASDHQVVAVSRTPERHRSNPRVRWIHTAEGLDELRRMRERGPVTAIHTVALTDHGYCEAHPDQAMAINAGTVAELAPRCRDMDVPLIYVCTDGLFPQAVPGTSPRYWSRADRPEPVSAYGRSKLAAEQALTEAGWGHSIRMSFVGASLGTGRGLVAFLATCLRNGNEVPGFTDNWFSPTPATRAAEQLIRLAGTAPSGHGMQQWGCMPAITKHDYLERVARAAGYEPHMVARRRSELPNANTAPLDQSLQCDRCWSLDEVISESAQALRDELA